MRTKLVILAICLLALVGLSYWDKGIGDTFDSELTVESEAARDIPKDWKTHTSEMLDVSFRYPPEFTVKEEGGIISVMDDPALASGLTITREYDLLQKVWGLQAWESRRSGRFIVTSYNTSDPSIARQYILMPESFPEGLEDTGANTEGLRIALLGGDSFDPKETLTETLEDIVFSIQDLR